MLDSGGLRETLILRQRNKKTSLEGKCEERPSEKLTEDLHFDVSWLFNKLLHKQGSVPESRQGFRVGPLVILLKFLTNRQEKYECGFGCCWVFLRLKPQQ